MIECRYINLRDEQAAQRLIEVQKAAYAVEASLIGSDNIPPLNDTLEKLRDSNETFIGAYVSETLIGAISYKIEGKTLDIHRMMVHPDYFRRGYATILLHYIFNVPGIKRFIVSTGTENEPAKRLYKKHGFVEVHTFEVNGGIQITEFEKGIE